MKVVLTTVDETRGKVFFLNNTDTVGQAKSLWANAVSCDVNSFVLVSGGQVVSNDALLEELPQLYPGIMELLVDEEMLLPVRAFHLKDEPKALASLLSVSVAKLYEAARELLGIAEGLEARFRVGDQVLSGERSLLENGVAAASGVEVEVGWRTTVKRVAGRDEEGVLFFSGVLSAVASPGRRVLCGDRHLRRAADVEALLLNAFEASNAERLVVEESSPVSVLEDGLVQSEPVWPQEGLMCESAASEVMFDERLMAGGDPRSLLVPPPWLLHRAPLRLVARLTSGKRQVLRVPRDGVVSDVVKAARPLEGARRKLQVVLGSRELDAHASLRSLALQDGSQVRLRCPPTSIRVRLGELELRWELPRAQDFASFGEIVAGISPGDRTRRRILLSGLLVCEGCGRRLSKERQGLQMVPAACCELRSMRLRFAEKAARDPTVQIIPLFGPEKSSHFADAASQTEGPDCADVAVQTIQKPASESFPGLSRAASKSDVRDPVEAPVQKKPTDDSLETMNDLPTVGALAEHAIQKSTSESSSRRSKAGSQTNAGDSVEAPVQKKSMDDSLETMNDLPTVGDGLHLIGAASMHLPDGFVLLCSVEKTPEYIIELLRRKRYVFRTINFIVRGKSMCRKIGWKKQTLKENGVNNGDQVTLKTLLPQTVVVSVDGKDERFETGVNVGENCWQKIEPKLPISDGTKFDVFYQEGLYFIASDDEYSSAVNSVSKDLGKLEDVYISEKAGYEVIPRAKSKHVMEFLSPTQRLVFALTGDPILRISSGGVLGLEEVPKGTLLKTLPSDAFFDPQYVAMVHGFCFRFSNAKPRHVFLPTKNGKFVFTRGGNVFANIELIRSSHLVKGLTEKRTWILLRSGDLVPRWLFPRGLVISLYRREGVDLQIEKERLVRKNPCDSTEGSRWVMPREADELDDRFANVVRNCYRKKIKACVTI